jgi:hypothetical protein
VAPTPKAGSYAGIDWNGLELATDRRNVRRNLQVGGVARDSVRSLIGRNARQDGGVPQEAEESAQGLAAEQ